MQLNKCIAMYIRLSKEDENLNGQKKTESNSVTAQRKLLSGFVEKQVEFKDMLTVEYVDDGYSGTTFNRPSFKRMMEDARDGRIQIIVIKDFSRFGRDHLEVGNYLEKILPLLGIRIISVNDGFDSENCAGMTGGMSVALKNMLNAMYIQDLSRKVQSAMRTHVENGEYISPRPKYGYKKDPVDRHHLIVDPEAAEIVRLVFTMAADGKNKKQIARYLNENKVPTCSEYMVQKGIWSSSLSRKEIKLWSDRTITDMLRDEIYLGNIVWNRRRGSRHGTRKMVLKEKDEWVIVKGTHEAIVSEILFKKANELAFRNVKMPYRPKMTGGVPILCASCGRKISKLASRNTMYCSQASITALPGCKNSRIRTGIFEETVLNCARNMVQFISEQIENQKKEWQESSIQEEKITALSCERNRLSSRKMKLYSDYRSGSLAKEQYLKEYQVTLDRIEEINQQIVEIEIAAKATQEKLRSADEKQADLVDIAALKTFDKTALSKIIEKIYVHGNDKIEIIWKMDDFFFDGDKREVIDVSRKITD